MEGRQPAWQIRRQRPRLPAVLSSGRLRTLGVFCLLGSARYVLFQPAMNVGLVEFDLLSLITDVSSTSHNATEESNQEYGNGIQHLFTRPNRNIPNQAPPL